MQMLKRYNRKASSMRSGLSSGACKAGPLNLVLMPANAMPQTVLEVLELKLEFTDIPFLLSRQIGSFQVRFPVSMIVI